MKKIASIGFLLVIVSCASSQKSNEAKIVDQVDQNCSKVSTLSSIGFSLFPPLATTVAEAMLKEKADEFNSNTVVIDKRTGIFKVEMEATGYNCQ